MRNITVIFAAVAAMIGFSPLLILQHSAHADTRPNILLIISDDQRFDDMNGNIMPQTWNAIFEQGTQFTRTYVTTPACCPSRASILTGLYACNHRVIRNAFALEQKTVVQRLRSAGYYTGLVGKYLNTWEGRPRNEFNFWVSFRGGSAAYFNPLLNIDGRWHREQGYITSILGSHARRFIRESSNTGKPFFLVFTPNAPHSPAKPAPDTLDMYTDYSLDLKPNMTASTRSDKADWIKRMRPLKPERLLSIEDFHRNQLRTLWTLDVEIGSILNELSAANLLEQTAIFYISDNGVMLGEHALQSKDVPYEGAVRVPFAMRYPPLVPQDRSYQDLTANIDIAATIYDLAGVEPPYALDGVSLLDLIYNRTSWRDALLLEGWRRSKVRRPFAAVHTGDAVYIRYLNDRDELYDLNLDPYQLSNAADLPQYSDLKHSLQHQLEQLMLSTRGSLSLQDLPGKQRYTKFPPPPSLRRLNRRLRHLKRKDRAIRG